MGSRNFSQLIPKFHRPLSPESRYIMWFVYEDRSQQCSPSPRHFSFLLRQFIFFGQYLLPYPIEDNSLKPYSGTSRPCRLCVGVYTPRHNEHKHKKSKRKTTLSLWVSGFHKHTRFFVCLGGSTNLN
jgi:hypothetical protein